MKNFPLVLNERKATQIAASLIGAPGQTMDLRRLMALMYLAYRAVWIHGWYAILDDIAVRSHTGPILAQTFSLAYDIQKVDDERQETRFWHQHIVPIIDRMEHFTGVVTLIQNPGKGELSQFIEKNLAATTDQFSTWSTRKILKHTRTLLEWKPLVAGPNTLGPLDILVAGGMDLQRAKAIADDQDAILREQALFRSLGIIQE